MLTLELLNSEQHYSKPGLPCCRGLHDLHQGTIYYYFSKQHSMLDICSIAKSFYTQLPIAETH